MSDLFNGSGAVFSECRKYRYVLFRIWNHTKPMVMFIGLNPSTANEMSDDPTIRRVKKFAYDWGFGGVYMLNLFAWISTDPAALLTCADPIGENDIYLKAIAESASKIIFAWGGFKVNGRDRRVIEMFPDAHALVINKDGTPGHPLYVPKAILPIRFTH